MMHYYPHYIADFNNATRHLSRLERSIYRDCLELYYDIEGPLDGTDLERLQRRLLCHDDEEKAALDSVLNEFFEEEGGLYMNSRCDREIVIYKSKDKDAAKRQENANARKKKYRDDRRDMFSELRNVGVVPTYNIKMEELRALHNEHYQINASNSKEDASGTSRERLGDASGTTNQNQNQNQNQSKVVNSNNRADYSVIDSIQDWQQPELSEINAMLMLGAPPMKPVAEEQYNYQLGKFKNYYAEKEIEGTYIQTEGRRKDMLAEWIRRDYQHSKPKRQAAVASEESARPHSNRSDSFDSGDKPKLTREQQIVQNNIELEQAKALGVSL